MKIINMSDIHGDFETFDKASEVIKASDAEVLAINGDLAGSVFDEDEKESFAKAYQVMANLINRVYQDTQGQVRTLHDIAVFLTSNRVKADDTIKKAVIDYLALEKIARERQLIQYTYFKQRFDDLSQKVILVPGNWDGKCIDDVLAQENIHNKTSENVAGIGFVGYGGSDMYPNELPQDLIINFNQREAFNHLSKHNDAEIAITHETPAGFEGNGRDTGKFSLLAYLYRNSPTLILSGHTHSPCLAKEPQTHTVFMNPGNLGRYQDQDFETFLELEIDKDLFVTPRKIYKVNIGSVKTKQFEEVEV